MSDLAVDDGRFWIKVGQQEVECLQWEVERDRALWAFADQQSVFQQLRQDSACRAFWQAGHERHLVVGSLDEVLTPLPQGLLRQVPPSIRVALARRISAVEQFE